MANTIIHHPRGCPGWVLDVQVEVTYRLGELVSHPADVLASGGSFAATVLIHNSRFSTALGHMKHGIAIPVRARALALAPGTEVVLFLETPGAMKHREPWSRWGGRIEARP